MRSCFALLLVCVATTPALPGQWSLAPEVGLTAFSGSGRDSSRLRVGPTRATVVALRIGREFPHLAVGVRVLTGSTGFGATDGDLTVIQEHQLRLVEFAGFLSWTVAQVGTASRLGFEAGPVLDLWMPQGASSRSRVGAVAALSWAFPVSPRLDAALRLEGTRTGSLFDAADLPPSAQRRATWRRGVGFALQWHRRAPD
ncbi:MAG TPA: hypothetical protein VFP39_12925 [Gemmatimonadales bacterium]|nr:hypothetical protein [Gemmatimonadales bacterium]